VRFIDEHRHDRFVTVAGADGGEFGVEPICRVLSEHGCPIAPSTYWAVLKRPACARVVRDARLLVEIRTAQRPNQLWVVDFTYVATWAGFVYVGALSAVLCKCVTGVHGVRPGRGGLGTSRSNWLRAVRQLPVARVRPAVRRVWLTPRSRQPR
jgi:hypothetical protein